MDSKLCNTGPPLLPVSAGSGVFLCAVDARRRWRIRKENDSIFLMFPALPKGRKPF
jgi:hypothetical protein